MTGLARRAATGVIYGGVVLFALYGPWPTFVVFALALFALGVTEVALLHRGRTEAPAALTVGAAYLGLGLFALTYLWGEGRPNVQEWLLLAVSATWGADVTAYAVGSMVGRRPIAPRISPRKTWEGTIGGFAGAAAVTVAVGALLSLPATFVAVAAIGIGPVALAGDLLESWMKRRVGAKDSGSLLPGHGGILDRIDSLLAVGLFVALLVGIGLG